MKRVLFARTSGEMDRPGRALHSLIRCLDRSQIEPHIAVPRGGELVEKMRELGVPVHEVPLNRSRNSDELNWQSEWVGRAPWRTRQLGVLMESLRPDVVHLDGLLGIQDTLAARRYADRHQTLVVWHVLEVDRLQKPSEQCVFNEVLRSSDVVVAESEDAKKWLPSRAKLEVIPAGCDLTDFTPRGDDEDSSEFTVGWVGKVRQDAGIDNVLATFPRIVDRCPEARLLVCALPGAEGMSSLASPRKRAAGELPGLVEWHPPTDRRHEVYRRLACLLVLDEGSQLDDCVVEAQACGVPVVGFESPQLRSLCVHGQTGYLVPRGDLRAAGEAVIELLRDPDLREEMGAVASRHARAAFASESTATRIQRLYDRELAAL